MASFKQYTLNNGNKRWKFQAYLGTHPVKGTPVKTTRSGFKTKKEAIEFIYKEKKTISLSDAKELFNDSFLVI